MTQLSLYVSTEILGKIEGTSKISGDSISKVASKILSGYYLNSWPHGYEAVFGSIDDETFQKYENISFSQDVARESL